MLHRRGSQYISRVVVPTALRPLLGRREITRSLRTGDRREARRRAALWETHLGTFLAIVRTQGRSMTRDQLDQLTRRYLAAKLDEIEERLALEWTDTTGREVHVDDLCELAGKLDAELSRGSYERALEDVRRHAPGLDAETERKLARRFLEAKAAAVAQEVAAFTGQRFALARALEPAVGAATPSTHRATLPFSEVARLYGEERVTEGKWSAKTEMQNRAIFGVLADLLGDPSIGDVTKDAIRRLGRDIAALPSNMTKRFPGLSPRAVVKALEGDISTARLEPLSINKYRQLIRSLFRWAMDHDLIATNPAVVLKDVEEGSARDARLPFSDDDLRLYFAGLPQTPEPAFLYWVPRILAYSGMRLGECAKLTKGDIRMERGVWVFDVNENQDGKKLKTDASRRLVPIHARLVELGLLDFVTGQEDGFLWPADMRTASDPKRGDVDKLSKLLGRRLRDAGVVDKRKTGAHSFRHTVATRLKAESVPNYQIADLIGHEDDSMTTGRYGKATDVQRLAAVVSLLRLPI